MPFFGLNCCGRTINWTFNLEVRAKKSLCYIFRLLYAFVDDHDSFPKPLRFPIKPFHRQCPWFFNESFSLLILCVLLTLLPVEDLRSTPGRSTDVSQPSPLQNSSIELASLAGDSSKTFPTLSTFSSEDLVWKTVVFYSRIWGSSPVYKKCTLQIRYWIANLIQYFALKQAIELSVWRHFLFLSFL